MEVRGQPHSDGTGCAGIVLGICIKAAEGAEKLCFGVVKIPSVAKASFYRLIRARLRPRPLKS
jgi:hypothetical protein